jgi:polysaccharide export outer membrane protein
LAYSPPVSEGAKLSLVVPGSAGVPGISTIFGTGEFKAMQSFIPRNCWRRFALLLSICVVLLLIANAAIVNAQTVNAQTDPCNGPLSSLLPECQSSIGSIASPSIRPVSASTIPLITGGDAASPPTIIPVSEAIAPEPPSEFQRFIASSVGEVPPIFGASLFEKVPTTFAPLDRVPVTADYVIGPGDEILLRVWGQLSMDLRLPVDRAGLVFIPQVGSIPVSGIQFKQLSSYLKSQMERVFRNFDLTVNMGQLRSIQILVMGKARRPGSYTISSLSTLVNALFATGGPSAQGSMRRIQLKRGAQVTAEVDLYDLLLRGDKSGDVPLLPGDVVYIPAVGSQVAVVGSVKTPAIYELKDEKTIGELIQISGGLSIVADRQRATLERIKEGVSREVLELALTETGMRLPVSNGDMLRVNTIAPRFEAAVTLRGNVANPGRFRWHAGMKLKEIIPDKESLVTRDYWKKQNLFGNKPAEDLASAPATKGTALELPMPNLNWSYAVIERQNPKDLMTKLIPFNLGRLILENDEAQNLELLSGDLVTIFSQADIRVPQLQQTRTVRLEGEFNAPGIYTVEPGETLGQLIQKAGGLTPQAYLFGAEFHRESVRQDQQRRIEQYMRELEQEASKAVQDRIGNASSKEATDKLNAEVQNQQQMIQRLRLVQTTGRIVLGQKPGSNDITPIAHMTLEDGDRFIVPAKPATINVMGAVYNPNALGYSENRQVKEYIAQTGGYTRSADNGHVYIIRADGSALPVKGTSSFEKMVLNPGDTIVVPEHLLKTTFLSGLRSWSEVISNFGLGAAAINVLR